MLHVNIISFAGALERLHHRWRLHTRRLDSARTVAAFGSTSDAIERVYVINLDRKPDRWQQVSKELGRFRDRSGDPLLAHARRFSAVDARYRSGAPDKALINPSYSLADQLSVEPNPHLSVDAKTRTHRIDMTPPEIAVALSHIEVWKLIAEGEVEHVLVLEDDAYFPRGFARQLDETWSAFRKRQSGEAMCDLLYLSFKEVGPTTASTEASTAGIRRPKRGVWQASGYLLSRAGARKLLALLPAYGPIDLWLNLQFDHLDVFLASRSIIEQRIDLTSTNSYSVLPVLVQFGALTREKPLIPRVESLHGPVIAYGPPDSGLTALATALSMMGYACCNDLEGLPGDERARLLNKQRGRIFNAYVNVGTFSTEQLAELVELYPSSRFITTDPNDDGAHLPQARDRFLCLPHDHQDKWAALSRLLEREYPAFAYPDCEDIGQRELGEPASLQLATVKPLKFDRSPWIVPRSDWPGITVVGDPLDRTERRSKVEMRAGDAFETGRWKLRDDTFPSNLVLFSEANFTMGPDHTALTLQEEITPVRSFTSAALASRTLYRYGTFAAELRPPNVSGLITGMFLHRNGPRQEIDIEFLGDDTSQMLVNVYFNPGIEGTKLEYGYRGTPIRIDLGFDAVDDFHLYEIEWLPEAIRWRVDGVVVHERVLWNPTPIPNLAMEFNINLWHSRSTKLAGKLNLRRLPAHVEVRSIRIDAVDVDYLASVKS